MKKLLFISLILFFVSGCKTRTIFVPVQKDSLVYVTRLEHLLIGRHDSIIQKNVNDTVFLEKYHTMVVHRDRTDTVKVEKSVEIPVPQPPEIHEKVPKWCWWVLLVCAGYIGFQLIKWKIRK